MARHAPRGAGPTIRGRRDEPRQVFIMARHAPRGAGSTIRGHRDEPRQVVIMARHRRTYVMAGFAWGAGPTNRCSLPAAAFFCVLEAVEKPGGIRAGQCVQPVRLAFLDGVMRDSSLRTEKLRLPLHFRVPAIFVVFAHIHEDAQYSIFVLKNFY